MIYHVKKEFTLGGAKTEKNLKLKNRRPSHVIAQGIAKGC
jgi:hypothetical protein